VFFSAPFADPSIIPNIASEGPNALNRWFIWGDVFAARFF
jgi:hypothetical protein